MQQVWRKRWRNTGWIALGAITLVLLVSAIQKKNHKVCTGIEISFNRDGNNFFVDEKGILAVLKSYGSIKDQPIENIDLKVLENRLKNDRWIANAELFFDNKQVLQVIVDEKEPVARILTIDGSSFYIDSACKRLPLSEKLSARIPMFTNFPSNRAVLSKPDSQLLASAKDLARYIQSDEFWKAQVAQVDITPTGFEMIPTVGSHIVSLGKEGEWRQKFDRLFSFYKQVWTQVGFEKYEKIDVQFDDQVIATIKGAKPSHIDSAKARIAYEKILAEVKKSATDTGSVNDNKNAKDTGKMAGAVTPKTIIPFHNVETKKILLSKENILKEAPGKKFQVKPAVVKNGAANTMKQVSKPAALTVSAQKTVTIDKKLPKAVLSKPGKGEHIERGSKLTSKSGQYK